MNELIITVQLARQKKKNKKQKKHDTLAPDWTYHFPHMREKQDAALIGLYRFANESYFAAFQCVNLNMYIIAVLDVNIIEFCCHIGGPFTRLSVAGEFCTRFTMIGSYN